MRQRHSFSPYFEKNLDLAYCHIWKIEGVLIQFLETSGVFLSFSFFIDSSFLYILMFAKCKLHFHIKT